MSRNPLPRCTIAAFVVGLIIATHSEAHDPNAGNVPGAEDAGAAVPGASRDESDSRLEQVVVTARRREEDVQAVPIAITVVSQQTLRDNNIQTIGDLQYLVPSMSAITGLSRDALNVSIRGQGLNGSGIPGVIAYLNEVPIPTDHDGNLLGGPGLLFDLENIQALKGPQGTLFGRNSVGGALLLQTARPKDEFGGRVQVSYGNYNDREVDGAVNVPVVEQKLLTRIAFSGQVRDGFTQLQAEPLHPGGIDADDRDDWAVRGTVTFHPLESFQNDSIVTYQKYTSHGSPLVLTDLNPATASPAQFALLAEQQALGVRTLLPVNVNLASGGSNLAVDNISRLALSDDITLRNIVGLDVANQVFALDADATPLAVFEIPSTPRDQTFRQYSDEIQLLGSSLNKHLNWIVGAFYLDQVPTKNFVLQTGSLFGVLPFDVKFKQGQISKALFGQGTYGLDSILPGLELTGGARYTWDDVSQVSSGGSPGSKCTEPTLNCEVAVADHANSSALSWTAGLSYQIAQTTMAYLTGRRGYREGGFNTGGPPGHLQFNPEYVNDVELGIKSDFDAAGVPVRVNADIYYEKYRDIQVTLPVFLAGGGFQNVTANAAAARIDGAEIEILAQVTHDLQIGGSYDYLNFAYTSFDPGVDPDTYNAIRRANRPPAKFSAKARYRLPLPAEIGTVSMRANWAWQAAYNGDTSQPGAQLNAFGLLNVSADWDGVFGSKFDASLFASNVTNKLYSVGGVDVYNGFGYAVQRYGEPRMYGVRLNYRFGAE